MQAYDTELKAIAGLTSMANKGIQFTGAGSAATFDLTSAAKTLLDDDDVAAMRTTLGLGDVATQNKDDISITGGSVNGAIIGATTPAAITGTTITANSGFVGNLTGDLVGNAATATKLANARTIAGNNFDGSANISIAAADLSDVTSGGSGAIITSAERTKLARLE